MKPEKPALGISKSSSWGDAAAFTVECSCTDPDHAVGLWIEVSTEEDIHDEIEVTFYARTTLKFWRGFRERLSDAWAILRGAESVRSHSMLLKKQAALNLSAAIVTTIEELENRG